MSEDELPEGWAETKLGDLADLMSGAGFPLEHQGRTDGSLPFFKVGNLGEVPSGEPLLRSAHSIDERMAQQLGAKIIPPGAVVFAKIGMAIRLNRRRLIGVRSCIDNNMMAAISCGAVEDRWLLRSLETIDFMPLTQATTVPSIRKSELSEIAVPLPPFAEQRRIVEKVEALLAHVNAARARLAKVPTILKRFRQSILSAACSGRLTEDWRLASGSSSPDAIDGELPAGWQSPTVGEICQKVTDGEHLSPKTATSGVPLLSAKDVRDEGVLLSNCKFVSEADSERFRGRCDPDAGDVLVVSRGATIGRTTIVQTTAVFCLMGSVILLKPGRDVLGPYLVSALCSPDGQSEMQSLCGHSAQQAIYIRDICGLHVPLPPLTEQHEIVRRVDALFKLADTIEARVAAATARADKITQAILAKAFRGELVPTEAELARQEGRDYEPASALLARIRAARTASEAASSPATRTPRRRATAVR
jgi:type I restriction enzyme S subunit